MLYLQEATSYDLLLLITTLEQHCSHLGSQIEDIDPNSRITDKLDILETY